MFLNALEYAGGVIENLSRIRLSAPGGGVFGVRQQILGAEWNALERAAQTLALDIAIHVLGIFEGHFAERKSEGVVPRTYGFQAIAECARKLDGGELLVRQFLIDFGDAGEEDVVRDGGHRRRLGLERGGGLGGHGQLEFVELTGTVLELGSRGFQFFIRVRGKRLAWWLRQQHRGRGQRRGEFTASECTHEF